MTGIVRWKNVIEEQPPVDTPLWGYDVLYGGLMLVIWNGKNRFANGLPVLCARNNDAGDDEDASYLFWKEAQLPNGPNNDEVERIQLLEEKVDEGKYSVARRRT